MGHHRTDRAMVGKRTAAGAGHAVSRALPARAPRPDSIRVEGHRQQPPRTVLLADAHGTEAVYRRAHAVAAHVPRGEPRPRCHDEQLGHIMGWITEGWRRMRSIGRRETLERGLDE